MKLRLRAAGHGRSMEEEAREILKAGLRAKRLPRLNLAESIRRYVEPLGGVELALPPRQPFGVHRSSPSDRTRHERAFGSAQALPSVTVLRLAGRAGTLVVFSTTITQAEILYGIETLPPGRRRTRLLEAVEKMFAGEFRGPDTALR